MTIKKSEFNKAQAAELLDAYASAAVSHNEATEAADDQAANKQRDILAAIYRELRSRGVEVQYLLLGLFDHPDVAVRGWASSHAMEFAPGAASSVLKAIVKEGGKWSLDAEMVLAEWQKGTLSFPKN